MQFFVFTNTNNENLAIKKLFDLKSNKIYTESRETFDKVVC